MSLWMPSVITEHEKFFVLQVIVASFAVKLRRNREYLEQNGPCFLGYSKYR